MRIVSQNAEAESSSLLIQQRYTVTQGKHAIIFEEILVSATVLSQLCHCPKKHQPWSDSLQREDSRVSRPNYTFLKLIEETK